MKILQTVAALACMGCASAHAMCGVSAVSLAFGNYSEFATNPTDSVGNVTVTCSGSAGAVFRYSIALSAGGGGTFSTRRMRSGWSSSLNYNLYTTPARATVWGDGNGGSTVVSDAYSIGGTSVTRMYPVYGRIFARQKAFVGAYTDTIVVTVNF